MKLDFPEPTKEQKAADVKRLIQNLDSQVDDQARRAKQEEVRNFDTRAPIAAAKVVIDPLKAQLMAHFDALTTDYARRLAVQQIAGLAGLCKTCPKEPNNG